MAATMQLQVQAAQTRRVSRQVSHKAFVASPLARKAAVPQAAPVSRAASRVVVRAVAEAKAPTPAGTEVQEWYACVASAEFFFNDVQNEPFAEQLREKKRWYDEQGKTLDFFIVTEPAWLEAKFPKEAQRVRKPAVALVSSDPVWITFMKLRLDRVLKLDLGRLSVDEVTKSNGPVPQFEPNPALKNMPYTPYAFGWWNVFERK